MFVQSISTTNVKIQSSSLSTLTYFALEIKSACAEQSSNLILTYSDPILVYPKQVIQLHEALFVTVTIQYNFILLARALSVLQMDEDSNHLEMFSEHEAAPDSK
jgi:hypothetical protein